MISLDNMPSMKSSNTDAQPGGIAVAYLARGADLDWRASFERFLRSWRRFRPGTEHSLYVIFKGFSHERDLQAARALFAPLPHTPLLLDDAGFDMGAYARCARRAREHWFCALNTASEILADDWLRKLHANAALPGVGLVGATGSYESLVEMDADFPRFPNVHLRSNAFLIERALFIELTEGVSLDSKLDAYRWESGAESFTRKVRARAREVLVVGRNGRGYSPPSWANSGTFRLAAQDNLLIGDNQTRNFAALPYWDKQHFTLRSWGHLGFAEEALLPPPW
jgi:hypothetical protein